MLSRLDVISMQVYCLQLVSLIHYGILVIVHEVCEGLIAI